MEVITMSDQVMNQAVPATDSTATENTTTPAIQTEEKKPVGFQFTTRGKGDSKSQMESKAPDTPETVTPETTSPEDVALIEPEASQPSALLPDEPEPQRPDGGNELASRIDLDTITAEILYHKQQAETSFLEMGRLLIEAKDKVKRAGLKWLPWLQDNFEMTPRTAQKLMELSREFGKAKSISHLGYTKASMLVALPPPKREDFMSNFYDFSTGESKSPEDMTAKQFGSAVQEYKKRTSPPKRSLFPASRSTPNIPEGERPDPVKDFEDKVSSLEMRLDDVVSQIFDFEGDLDIRIELYDSLFELLNRKVSGLMERRPEIAPADDHVISDDPNSGDEVKAAS
jgi:hypothetical protein